MIYPVGTTNALATDRQPILSLRGISKRFGRIHALEDVNLDLYDKEILGLLGDNGAGKSTLIKIITGVHKADEDKVLFEGKDIDVKGPDHAKRLGIRTVCQELAFFRLLDVLSNLFAGVQITCCGFLRESKRRKQGNGNYAVHLR